MNSKPLISIVTASLNSGKTIRTTIEYVLNPPYQNLEYILKDGGSKDDTIDIANEYRERFQGRLRIIQQKDRCMYEAMNQGISVCHGDMIGIINSDDYYSPDTLERVAEAYACSDTKLLVIIGDMERVSGEGKLIYRYHFTQDMVDRKSCFGHPSLFASKAVYDKIGLYDTSYSLAADGDWQYRAMEDEEVRVMLSPFVFNHMREGGASDNPKYRWKWVRERSRMQRAHHRGSKARIYAAELAKVIKRDIKRFAPSKSISFLYKIRYAKKGK